MDSLLNIIIRLLSLFAAMKAHITHTQCQYDIRTCKNDIKKEKRKL